MDNISCTFSCGQLNDKLEWMWNKIVVIKVQGTILPYDGRTEGDHDMHVRTAGVLAKIRMSTS
jgi:hypothetical protein